MLPQGCCPCEAGYTLVGCCFSLLFFFFFFKQPPRVVNLVLEHWGYWCLALLAVPDPHHPHSSLRCLREEQGAIDCHFVALRALWGCLRACCCSVLEHLWRSWGKTEKSQGWKSTLLPLGTTGFSPVFFCLLAFRQSRPPREHPLWRQPVESSLHPRFGTTWGETPANVAPGVPPGLVAAGTDWGGLVSVRVLPAWCACGHWGSLEKQLCALAPAPATGEYFIYPISKDPSLAEQFLNQ